MIHGVVVNVHDITDRREAELSVAAAELRFRSLVQHAADGIIILDGAAQGLYVSPSYERLTGYTADEIVGRGVRDFCHPDDLSIMSGAWSEMLAHPTETLRVQVRVRHGDGRWRWQEISISNRIDDPAIGGMILNVRDVTDRKALDELLAEESRLLEMIAWDEPLTVILDRVASLTAMCTDAKYCLVRLFDGDTLRLAAAPGFPHHAYERVANVALGPSTPSSQAALMREEVFVADHRTDDSDDAFRDLAASVGIVSSWAVPIELPSRNAIGGTISVLFDSDTVDRDRHRPLIQRVVSLAAVAIEQARAREELEFRAFHDELTGLANRALLTDRLTHALQRARRTDASVAVLYFDLDRFKMVNDSLGHDAGDRLLVQVSQRLREGLRVADTIARLGGDEFVVLIENANSEREIHGAAQRVAQLLEPPFEVDGEAIFVSASIGVALSSSDDDTHDHTPAVSRDLLREADDAMYRAKQRGRGSVEYETAGDTPSAANPLARVTALHRAIDRNEMVVHYQPIVDLISRQPVGAEALVRWDHPELGLVLPGEFISLAEDTGLIVPLGWQVLEQALRRLEHWPTLAISVNVSARQLSEPDFVARLEALLGEVPRNALTLEITESLLIDDPRRAAQTLASIDDLGVRLALDDFGTGYSNLSYLSTLPIHQLKIDRSFIAKLGDGPEHDTLVSGIIHLAQGLGLQVVAEGIETETQARRLTELGCRLAQGFHFGRPQQWNRASLTGTGAAAVAVVM